MACTSTGDLGKGGEGLRAAADNAAATSATGLWLRVRVMAVIGDGAAPAPAPDPAEPADRAAVPSVEAMEMGDNGEADQQQEGSGLNGR